MTVHEAAVEAATKAMTEKLDVEAGFALTAMFRALAEIALEAAMPHIEKAALTKAAEDFQTELGTNAANPAPKYIVGWLLNRAARTVGGDQ